jgi:hypothetical protein
MGAFVITGRLAWFYLVMGAGFAVYAVQYFVRKRAQGLVNPK